MKSYNTFIFDSYTFDPETGEIRLVYSLDDEVQFTEILQIPTEGIALNAIEQALFALHLAGGASYYKTCCPKQIEVRSGILNTDQANFWNSVYENGLGEFFYRNEIDFTGLINFPVHEPGTPVFHQSDRPTTGKVLVPIGGGKDSTVTIEKLRAEGRDITLLRMGGHPLIDDLVSVTGLPCITIKRKLPRKLFEMNEQGALNGHVPITAYLSCLAVVIAEVYGFDEVVMSNEKSASEGNVEYLGKQINHQWSKGEEFETAFDAYIKSYINKHLKYFSKLRDLTELEIAGEFAKLPHYFACTTSCNKNWKVAGEYLHDRWCGTCPKCTFVFALMAAHIKKDVVVDMFGKNIFEDASTIPLFKALLGIEGFKPFECVGTSEETKQAFEMIKERGEFDDTPVMQMFQENT
ncbi:MAG: endonuclease domain-containing protein [Candidatus Peribacter sp.]|jgi:UDP-N-acetyl-alpha-D-muramoyl-L-alanyl-L-glutamate epimerase|nr:endonuclease domain-containing protein [Candidatus Peribacter sp.]MBT4392736.1 endonuclease domain-containing protein [Candidatus Peribacter sp.]MBT4600647.1 endonuclease domain-containing protein [Candidatus Peribacter sp.]MBT5148684.1 endonuclease domain-containing protein [Candidatus Peribacter sp.]MBT5637721.1 endonuclease domain-containing protein [Candidatus Peribacter sp.]